MGEKGQFVKKSKITSQDLRVISVERRGEHFAIKLSGEVIINPGEGKKGQYEGLTVGSQFDLTSKEI